jgi:alkylation response protein AidB-like acyl-CoA dehydrogenase
VDAGAPNDASARDDAGDSALRTELIDGIRAHRMEFENAGERSEQIRALPREAAQTLRRMGLFWLKTPGELGGTPLTPLEFCDVMEELGYADSSTAWLAMVGNGGTGTAAGWLPDAGVRRVFVPGGPRPLVVGVPRAAGHGRPVAGGYVVSGRWGFASGIAHADWLIAGFQVPGTDGRAMVSVVPVRDIRVVDNWRVAGLQGTGSPDFLMDEVFVPAELTFDRAGGAVRGGALFRQEEHVFLSNEVPPLCVGMARRAVDEMTETAGRTARFPGGPAVSERAVFHKELGRAATKVKAARLVHRDAVLAAWEEALAGGGASEGVHAAVTAASIFAVETCAEVISDLFRYGGGRVLALSGLMQRQLRNALGARQHIGVSEQFYEVAGRLRVQGRFPRPKAVSGR